MTEIKKTFEDIEESKPIHIYADDLDETSLNQFEHCHSKDFVVAAALMPDAHAGYVAPIGSVLITKKYIVPAWVGYDIGCGVTAVKLRSQIEGEKILPKAKEHLQAIYEEVSRTVPMGLGKLNSIGSLHRETREKFDEIFKALKKSAHDPEILDWVKRKAPANLGSLGEGNHFIELGEDDAGDLWVVVHCGSRNVGHKVATKYMIKSAGSNSGFEDTHPLDVESDVGKEYLAILDFGLEFALLNRLEMAKTVKDCVETVLKQPLHFEVWTNKNHNHAIPETLNGETVYVHRKGATPAKVGERGVIPGTMRDGSYLVEGLGNDAFLNSSSHGAGRKMSRGVARKTISMDSFKESMKGIIGTVKEGTLDEAPDAYKDIVNVMELQKESVKVVNHIRPIVNWKGDNKSKRRR